MTADDPGRFTVGVFQDVAWAEKGLAALGRAGLFPESLSIVAAATPEVAALIEQVLSAPPESMRIAGVGDAFVHGPLIGAPAGRIR